jgi:hypothetical protein
MRLVWVAPILALALAGCGELGAIDFPLTGPPTDLTPGAAPTTPVEAGALPPPGVTDPGVTTPPPDVLVTPPLLLPSPGGAAVPAAPIPVTNLTRTDLLGGWTINTGVDACQLFVTLTDWIALADGTRAYRASTRDCTTQVLVAISAWTLEGQVVILASADGTTLARLTPISLDRFEGQIVNGGVPVAFFR